MNSFYSKKNFAWTQLGHGFKAEGVTNKLRVFNTRFCMPWGSIIIFHKV
jgi:hypothetical protein